MALVKLVEYDEASPGVRAACDDIRRTRGTDFINDVRKMLAVAGLANGCRIDVYGVFRAAR